MNDNSVQLLGTTYQQITGLYAQRADIDMKILAMLSKVGNIIASASVNVEATEEAPTLKKVVHETKVVAKPVAKPKAKPVEVKAPVAEANPLPLEPVEVAAPVVAAPVVAAPTGEPMTYEALCEIVNVVTAKAGGPVALQQLMSKYNAPYNQMQPAQQLEFGNAVQALAA